MPRYDRLPDGQRIRCYDSGPRTIDRYAVLFEDDEDPERGGPVRPYGPRSCLSMSEAPEWGFSQMSAACPQYAGRRIAFAALPANVQAHVIMRATPED